MKIRTRGWPTMLETKRSLRRKNTDAEKKLWIQLSKYHPEKFRRQHGIGPYIADFYHAKSMTVIEVDGLIHEKFDVKENDLIREEYLKERGYKIIRFKNQEVFESLNNVIEKINQHIS